MKNAKQSDAALLIYKMLKLTTEAYIILRIILILDLCQ